MKGKRAAAVMPRGSDAWSGGGVDGFSDKVGFIWSIADLLRGDYKAHEYGQVILPLTVLRRLDCVLQPTKAAVVARAVDLTGKIENVEPLLLRAARQPFYNVSPLDFARLLDDAPNIAGNLRAYIAGFSPGAVEVLDKYGFDNQITRLDNAGLLFHVVSRFADLDLHPDRVPNHAMGYIFEELLRKFSEMSNETAGEHFTPREVIRLMVNILFSEDDDALRGSAPVRTMFDPACGTGGMLTGGQDHLGELNLRARLEVFGQELNPETWAIARSDLMIKGQDPSRIVLGNSFTADGFAGQRFDYMLANPPFGVDWKRIERHIKDEHALLGERGRFGAGLPRVSDGSLLFLQHMISKMKPVREGGSRLAIVFSGSPMFSGGAGSGESEIRRWIIENDWLEGIVALPDQLFYNTGISTYFWVLTNRKSAERKGKIVLLDARNESAKMRKSLGDKRKYIPDDKIAEITRLYHEALDDAAHDERVKVFDNADFGYQRITVERPKCDGHGQPIRNRKGFVPDPDLRDNENVLLTESIDAYMQREVLPHVPDAWVDHTKTRIGYEIPFTRHFYRYQPPRSVAEIDTDIAAVEEEIQKVLSEVTR